MKPMGKILFGSFLLLPLALGLVSCRTVNKLDEYRVEDATMAVDMRVPPAPTFKIGYWVTLDSDHPVRTVLSIGTTIAKASEASEAEARMRQALASVDVPGILLAEASSACTTALDARREPQKQGADYLLDLDIHDYGIEADSPWQGVSLNLKLTASLFHNESGDLVWRRSIAMHQNASPAMFGFGSIVGNIVTAAALSELSTEQLEEGFQRLAVESARSLARTMEDDLYEARYDR
jgi:hypothetical protein